MFKKQTVVLLPTQQKAGFAFGKMPGGKLKLCSSMSALGIGTPYDLFILSDEEVKEGDWFIYGKKLYNRIKRSGLDCTVKIEMLEDLKHAEQFGYKDTWVEVYKSNCKKIIATTDKQLTILGLTDRGFNTYSGVVPEIPQSFIEKFVSEYNKGNIYKITEVMVEYDEEYWIDKTYFTPMICKNFENTKLHENRKFENVPSKLKINPDNTINIKS